MTALYYHEIQTRILDPRLGTEFPLPTYATPDLLDLICGR